jgi:iron complex transport system ATP-binding protein
MIDVQQISYKIDDKQILKNISCSVRRGAFIGLIGPNGSGKSTLLKMMYRYFKPTSGLVVLDEQDIWKLPEKQFAKEVAVVSQESPVIFDFSVRELVLMGRTPHKKLFTRDTEEDMRIVGECMALADITHLADRQFSNLSGGEKKRVTVARALAQQTDILILDEPTNHLDIEHQLQLMDLIHSLPITIIAALHDLNLAAAYCDELIVLKDGAVHYHGTPNEVLTAERIKEVFRVDAVITDDQQTKRPHIQYKSKRWKEGKINEVE